MDGCIPKNPIRTGPKYEQITSSRGICLGLRAGDAFAGDAAIGATESGDAGAAATSSCGVATDSEPGTSHRSARARGSRHIRDASRRWRQIAQGDGDAARIVAMVDVPVGG